MSLVLSAGRNRCGQLGIGSLDNPVHTFKSVLFNSKKYHIERVVPSHGEFVVFFAREKETQRQVLLGVGRNVEGQLPIKEQDPSIKEIRRLCELDMSEMGDKAVVCKIGCGSYHSVVQTQDNKIWSVGNNYYGQLGLGHTIDRQKFTRIEGVKALQDKRIQKISCGAFHTTILTADCNLYVCGSNGYGQLAQGDKDLFKPTLVEMFQYQVANVFCGVYYTIIITRRKKVYKCGLTVAEKAPYPYGIKTPMEEKFNDLADDEEIIDVSSNDFESYFLTSRSRIFIRGSYQSHNYKHFENQKNHYVNTTLLKLPKELSIKKIKSVHCPVAPDAAVIVSQNDRHECWVTGKNEYGELGLGHTKLISQFQKLDIDLKEFFPHGKILDIASLAFGDGSLYIVLDKKQSTLFTSKRIHKYQDIAIQIAED